MHKYIGIKNLDNFFFSRKPKNTPFYVTPAPPKDPKILNSGILHFRESGLSHNIIFLLQGTADFHVQGPRVPHRPQDEEVMVAGVFGGRQCFVLLRLIQSTLQNYFCRRNKGITLTKITLGPHFVMFFLSISGCHQLDNYTQYDFYKNVSKVWPMVRCSCQHGLWPRIQFRSGT
jgi:hypothetical protein